MFKRAKNFDQSKCLKGGQGLTPSQWNNKRFPFLITPVQLKMSGLKRKAPTDIEPSTFERELQEINKVHGLRNLIEFDCWY